MPYVHKLAKDESELRDKYETEMMSAPMGRDNLAGITVEKEGTKRLQDLKRNHPELYKQLQTLDRSALNLLRQ